MTDAPSGDPTGGDAPRSRAEARRAADGDGLALHSHVRSARSEFEHHVERARADFEHVNDRINQRTGRNLLLAILIGLVIGAAVLGSLLWIKWLFLIFALPVCILGIWEFSRALQAAGRKVDVWPQIVLGVVILVAGFLEGHWTHWVTTFAAVAFLIVWRLTAQMSARDGRRYGDVVSDVLVAGLVAIYVGFLASLTLVLLRQEGGEYWLLAMIAVVVVADTGAYASGLAFGKHPMAPRISPKKTWEGFAGAAIAAIAAAVLFAIFVLHVPWWAGVVFGVAILVTATIGDLGESMIKRDLGIKDMSSWLPGHGGVLDRLDSILPSAAMALALYFLLSPLVSA